MSEEKKSMIGPDGLNEFGQYLTDLRGLGNYTFEIEDPRGRFVDTSLDEVLTVYKAFLGSKQERFRVRITCLDYAAGMIHQNDRVISRKPK